jgi:hypothetical protein
VGRFSTLTKKYYKPGNNSATTLITPLSIEDLRITIKSGILGKIRVIWSIAK